MKGFIITGTYRVYRLGVYHHVPIVLTENTKNFYVLRWLKLQAREKSLTTEMHISLARHVLQMYNKEGPVMQKRDDLHRLAENNKSYIQLRKNAMI